MLEGIETETIGQRKERRLLRGCLEIARTPAGPSFGSSSNRSSKSRKELVTPWRLGLFLELPTPIFNRKVRKRETIFWRILSTIIRTMPAALPRFCKVGRALSGGAKAGPERTGAMDSGTGTAKTRICPMVSCPDRSSGRTSRPRPAASQDLLDSQVKQPELAAGLFQFAKLQLDDRNYDQAVKILDEARSWQPGPELRERIDFAAAAARYAAGQFRDARPEFAGIARSDSGLKDAWPLTMSR